MLMFHVDVGLGLVLKTTRFNDSESTLSFERHGALSDVKLCRMFSFTSLHTA